MIESTIDFIWKETTIINSFILSVKLAFIPAHRQSLSPRYLKNLYSKLTNFQLLLKELFDCPLALCISNKFLKDQRRLGIYSIVLLSDYKTNKCYTVRMTGGRTSYQVYLYSYRIGRLFSLDLSGGCKILWLIGWFFQRKLGRGTGNWNFSYRRPANWLIR